MIVKEHTLAKSQEKIGVFGAGNVSPPMSGMYSVAQSFIPTPSSLAKVKIKISATGIPTDDLIFGI